MCFFFKNVNGAHLTECDHADDSVQGENECNSNKPIFETMGTHFIDNFKEQVEALEEPSERRAENTVRENDSLIKEKDV